MSNRLVTYLKDLVEALFKDGAYLYARENERKRDISRLLVQLDARGIGILTDELPAFLKHLDQCLDKGTYTNPHMTLSRPKRTGEEIPVFLREIFLRIFDTEGKMVEHPCGDAVLFLRTILTFAKRIRLRSTKEAERNEVLNLISCDTSLPHPSLSWDLDDLGDIDSSEFRRLARSLHVRDFARPRAPLFGDPGNWILQREMDILQRCFDTVASQFGLAPHLRGERVRSEPAPRHGPGAVAELSKRSSKYELRNWPAKLQRIFPRDYYALPSFGWGFSCDRGPDWELNGINHEIPSRVIAVPKTRQKPRLIAAEPVSHMWIQQLLLQELDDVFDRFLLRKSLKLKDQSPNQRLAILGSIDGGYATLDLSEASDRVSCALVERFFRVNLGWLESFHSARTRYISYHSGDYSIYHMLKKFAMMGSACTFPVQSVIFATVGVASVLIGRGLDPTIKNIKDASSSVQVFGDDIIVPKAYLGNLIKFLEFLGLKVNKSKTFSGKNFRESCGMDAFRGVDVTPPHILEVPNGGLDQLPSLVETSNNFFKAGFWYTSECIRSTFAKWNKFLAASSRADLPVSLFTFCDGVDFAGKTRWNSDLQRVERLMVKTIVRSTEGEQRGSHRILQYFTERPSPIVKWKSGFDVHRTVKVRTGWL